MSASAIVLTVRGGDDSTAWTSLDVVTNYLHRLRPGLRAGLGLLNSTTPMVRETVKALASTGVEEITMVPMNLVSATDQSPVLIHTRDEADAANPGLNIVTVRPISSGIDLLNIPDTKLCETLHRTSTVEVGALVLACPDGGDLRGSSLPAREARQWSVRHKLPVQFVQSDITSRAIALAANAPHGQGRRHIAVGSLFLTPGPVSRAHQQAAIRVGALVVTPPTTENPRITELILACYAFAVMRLLGIDPRENGT